MHKSNWARQPPCVSLSVKQDKLLAMQVKLETFANRCKFKCVIQNIHRSETCIIRAAKQGNPLCQSLSRAITQQLPAVGCPRKANNASQCIVSSAVSHIQRKVHCHMYTLRFGVTCNCTRCSIKCTLTGRASKAHYTTSCCLFLTVWGFNYSHCLDLHGVDCGVYHSVEWN